MLTATARNIRTTLEMIKIEHTLFALPFAFLGAVLAAHGLPSLRQLVWITVAMVGARSCAMAFNRIVDREFDRRNPRTSNRALPAGTLSVGFVWGFTLLSAAIFFVAAAMLNRLTLLLAPVALASIMLYSFTKRWTRLSHLVLGWCLAIAPAGAWIAVRGALDSPVPWLLAVVVWLWTAGFDVLYACQDYEFDRQAGLRSIPERFGIQRALWISRLFHAQAFSTLVALYLVTHLGALALVGVIATGALLVYQHTLVRADDLPALAKLADTVRRRLHGRTTYFNVNRHFNPTNVCYADCKFCGFFRTPRQPDAYTHNIEDSLKIAGEAVREGATEL
ncbi:MAG: UbiA family prenyltransferase, partial [Pyrinomonadaceae bacterium]|nr:UbiA family prenyltransferase [Pyrinomonadaceae bacterium]